MDPLDSRALASKDRKGSLSLVRREKKEILVHLAEMGKRAMLVSCPFYSLITGPQGRDGQNSNVGKLFLSFTSGLPGRDRQ